MSTWLITGAGGFVGSHLLTSLRERPLERVAAVLAPTRADLDLTDPAAVADFVRRHRVTGILHLAASLDRSDTPAAERSHWRDTFEAGRVVIGQSVAHGVRHIIVPGTIEELGDHEGVLDIDLPPQPRTLYGLCKTLLREYAEYVARRAPVRIDWFRPFVVYGPGQRGEMLIPSAFRAAVTGQPCDFSDGTQCRDFLFVDDLVAWLRSATTFTATERQFRVHHLGSGTAVPVRDALEIISGEFPGAPLRIGARPRRAGEPLIQRAPLWVAGESGAQDWVAAVSLRDGLSRTAAWWREEATHS